MKKVLLTESQVKLITEEIDKNDSIQKLLFTDPAEIEFEKVGAGNGSCQFLPVVDGKKITGKFVVLTGEEVKIKNVTFYNLKIEVSFNIRNLGVAAKLFTAFILNYGPVCSFYKDGEEFVKALWNRIKKEGLVDVKTFKYNGEEAGLFGKKK